MESSEHFSSKNCPAQPRRLLQPASPRDVREPPTTVDLPRIMLGGQAFHLPALLADPERQTKRESSNNWPFPSTP